MLPARFAFLAAFLRFESVIVAGGRNGQSVESGKEMIAALVPAASGDPG
jgi:hypothetical protein